MSFESLAALVRLNQGQIQFHVQTPLGDTLLRCKLTRLPQHPRALLDLFEAMARYQGLPIDVVISAIDSSQGSSDSATWTENLQWAPSASVRVTWVAANDRQVQLEVPRDTNGRVA